MRLRPLLAPTIAVTAAAALALAGNSVVHASGPMSDGYYACSFDPGINCQPATIPTDTVTDTATITATETATTTVTATATTTVTATPTPDPTPLTGVSTPGLNQFPTAKIVRAYWSGLPSPTLPSAPAGAALVVSYKTVPTDTQLGADLDAWAATGRQVYWTWHHEPDNGDMTGSAFVTTTERELAVAAQHPAPNVHSLTLLTANSLTNGTAESYYAPDVDVIGFDCYTLSNEPKALDYAAAKGKPLLFGEVGNKTTGQTNTDSAALAYAQSFWSALTPNVIASIWWAGSTDTLTDKPNTLAFLQAQP